MAKLESFDFEGPWLPQLDEWVRGVARPLAFSIDALDRARYEVPRGLVGMPGVDAVDVEQITVRHVATKTPSQLDVLRGVGPKTIEVVALFLKDQDIDELGPHNASLGQARPKPPGIDLLMEAGHA